MGGARACTVESQVEGNTLSTPGWMSSINWSQLVQARVLVISLELTRLPVPVESYPYTVKAIRLSGSDSEALDYS